MQAFWGTLLCVYSRSAYPVRSVGVGYSNGLMFGAEAIDGGAENTCDANILFRAVSHVDRERDAVLRYHSTSDGGAVQAGESSIQPHYFNTTVQPWYSEALERDHTRFEWTGPYDAFVGEGIVWSLSQRYDSSWLQQHQAAASHSSSGYLDAVVSSDAGSASFGKLLGAILSDDDEYMHIGGTHPRPTTAVVWDMNSGSDDDDPGDHDDGDEPALARSGLWMAWDDPNTGDSSAVEEGSSRSEESDAALAKHVVGHRAHEHVHTCPSIPRRCPLPATAQLINSVHEQAHACGRIGLDAPTLVGDGAQAIMGLATPMNTTGSQAGFRGSARWTVITVVHLSAVWALPHTYSAVAFVATATVAAIFLAVVSHCFSQWRCCSRCAPRRQDKEREQEQERQGWRNADPHPDRLRHVMVSVRKVLGRPRMGGTNRLHVRGLFKRLSDWTTQPMPWQIISYVAALWQPKRTPTTSVADHEAATALAAAKLTREALEGGNPLFAIFVYGKPMHHLSLRERLVMYCSTCSWYATAAVALLLATSFATDSSLVKLVLDLVSTAVLVLTTVCFATTRRYAASHLQQLPRNSFANPDEESVKSAQAVVAIACGLSVDELDAINTAGTGWFQKRVKCCCCLRRYPSWGGILCLRVAAVTLLTLQQLYNVVRENPLWASNDDLRVVWFVLRIVPCLLLLLAVNACVRGAFLAYCATILHTFKLFCMIGVIVVVASMPTMAAAPPQAIDVTGSG